MAFLAPAFYAALDAVRTERNLLWKQVAEQTVISQSTFVRMRKGTMPDIATFGKLVQWANLDPRSFFNGESRVAPSGLPMIIASIHHDQTLSDEGKAALERIVSAAYEGLV